MHCDLLGEAGTTTAVIAVLTGIRLLAVDSSTWRVQLHVPLRKLQAVALGPPSAQHLLMLQLKPKRAQAAAAQAAAGEASLTAASATGKGSSEMRSLACHSEDAAASLHDRLVDALASLRAHRRVWHSFARTSASRREQYPISAALGTDEDLL